MMCVYVCGREQVLVALREAGIAFCISTTSPKPRVPASITACGLDEYFPIEKARGRGVCVCVCLCDGFFGYLSPHFLTSGVSIEACSPGIHDRARGTAAGDSNGMKSPPLLPHTLTVVFTS